MKAYTDYPIDVPNGRTMKQLSKRGFNARTDKIKELGYES